MAAEAPPVTSCFRHPPCLPAMPENAEKPAPTPSPQQRRCRGRSCTAVASLAAIVLAHLSASSQAFSPSGAVRASAGVTRRGKGRSCLTSLARRPSWSGQKPQERQKRQHEDAAGLAAVLSPVSCSGGGDSSSHRWRLSASPPSSARTPRRLPLRSSSTTMAAAENGSRQAQQQLELLPGTVLLRPGDPIEFWHAQGLVLGNYESPVPGRQSLVVRTESGEPLTIDAGQIVGVWREDEMSGRLPSSKTTSAAGNDGNGSDTVGSAAGWAEIKEEARALLQSTPARGLDLGPFWRAASSKGKGFVATPAHAAEFLFGDESPARLGLRKRPPFQFRGPGEVFRPSAVERAAAAQVLSGERTRFKRVTVLINVGGFKAVDNSVAVTREVADFCRVVNAVKRAAAANAAGIAAGYGDAAADGTEGGGGGGGSSMLARAGLFEPAFLLILHSLEAFAIGGDEQSLNPEARRAMTEIMGKTDPASAKSILVDVGLWTSRRHKRTQDGPTGQGDSDKSDDKGGDRGGIGLDEEAGDEGGVVPWSAEALEAAAALAKERARRATNYGKREPQGDVGAPAPFGRHDFRGAEFGVYCIDGAGTSFLDDAFSVDPQTREVFIHITDVQGLVPTGSTLDDVARLRAASEYLPQGPLFMMPPAALKALSFSGKGETVNEAVTVGIRLDPETGRVASSRVMLTTLPPVVPLTFDQTDRLLEAAEKGETGEGRLARIAAILRGSGYLNKKDLMETASYLTWRQNKTRASRDEEAGRLSLESLAAHCLAQTRATGLEHAVVPARGTGQGREVRLEGLGGGIRVHAKRAPGRGGRGVAIAKGQAVRVVIERVEPQLKQVVATEFLDAVPEAGRAEAGARGGD
ncbi:unnamed protein product [Scytosiphon promiscuus]